MITIIDITDSTIIDQFYKGQKFPVKDITDTPYLENDAFVIRAGSKSAMVIVRDGKLAKIIDHKILNFIKGENLEQKFYLSYLHDPLIKCVVVTGAAGSGKTIIAMAYAYSAVLSGDFQQIIVARPPVAPSKKFQYGYLPGSLEEKMSPWLRIFYDSLDKIKMLTGKNVKVEIVEQNLEYVKGLNFDNSIVLIDEAEDLTKQETKAILTRLGANSKIVVMGDTEQSTEAGCKNTLPEIVTSFRKAKMSIVEQQMFAAIELKTSLRSDFVNLVLKVL